MNKIFALLALVFTLTANAQQVAMPEKQCDGQIPYGKPVSSKQDITTVCRRAYILEHDNKAKIPQWVSYVLTPDHSTGCVKRTDSFVADESLSSRAVPKDYAKSGYDIGHQANDGDMSWSIDVERESSILSNAAPQLPGFNRGIWKRLEDQTRAWAKNRGHNLHIYVGPIYGKQDKTIGNGVVVPHGFYKIVTDLETKEVLVFKFPHVASKEKLDTFITSLAQVQKETGLVLPLPKDGKFSRSLWPSPTKSVRASKSLACTW